MSSSGAGAWFNQISYPLMELEPARRRIRFPHPGSVLALART
jgi:hypothetical protein